MDTHIVTRAFDADRPMKVGERVDATVPGWGNAHLLEDQGFIRKLSVHEQGGAAASPARGKGVPAGADFDAALMAALQRPAVAAAIAAALERASKSRAVSSADRPAQPAARRSAGKAAAR